MKMVRVLGIGSPFGEDQLGWEIVKNLQQQVQLKPLCSNYLDLIVSDRPGLRLLQLMDGAEAVFLVDAMQTGADPGTVCRLQNNELANFPKSLSSHSLGVGEAIEMGRALKVLPKTIIFYGVEIKLNGLQGAFSRLTRESIQQVSYRLTQELMELNYELGKR